MQEADATARGMADDDQVHQAIQELRQSLRELIASQPCVTLKQLAVNGGDLMRMGFPKGPALGQALQSLLNEVVDGVLNNDKEALLSRAGELMEQ